ncbi:hypothetical protein EZV62_012076 [Acer yangbiense]|uniref:Uncharacterized protein n=1 Tax=Acer yangbiense TaxID=1000413 RepID=A0A5C7HUE2_9ROSI|nr:hypothetical protein EZV62_012076 [Acer yangbiense]
MSKRGKQDSSTSSYAHLRTAYHNCFNRWYSEKFVKGQWDKEDCVSEWQKYRTFLSELLDDKHLSHLLEAQGIMDSVTQPDLRHPVSDNASGVS